MKLVNRLPIVSFVLAFAISQCIYASSEKLNSVSDHNVEILHHEYIPEILLEPTTENSGDKMRCSVSAFGLDFNLILEPNDRVIAELPPQKRNKLLRTCGLYRGHIDGIPESWVRFCKIEQKLSGMIWDGVELYILDSVSSVRDCLRHRPSSKESDNVIYRLSDVIAVRDQACGLDPSVVTGSPIIDYAAFIDELRELVPAETSEASLNINMAVVADVEFSQIQEGTFGISTAAAVAARINIVDGIFSEQVGVQISLVDVLELTDNGGLTSNNPNILLDQLGDFTASPEFDNPGVTHLFTGKNLKGSVVGIAFVGAVCSQRFGIAVDEIRNSGTSRALLVAHELAHNFGAPHDNESESACESTPGTFIMNPFLNGSDQFSQCSVDQMQFTINNASCLTIIDTDQSPVVMINSPDEGDFLPVDTPVHFKGTASDPEDGNLAANIVWFSDIDGDLGVGNNVSTILSLGTHAITASVTDSGGSTTMDTVTIAVVHGLNDSILFESHFGSGKGGFSYVDDAFLNTNKPAYAAGKRVANSGFTGGGLQVLLGGVNNADILNMSGGWMRTFTLDATQEVTVTLRYKLTQTSSYEAAEFSQVLFALDDTLVSVNGNDFLAEIKGNGNGGLDRTTGWVPIGVNLGMLSAGTHSITIGAFNNKKTDVDESTEILIDDVTTRGEPGASVPEVVFENHFNTNREEFSFRDDTFRGTSEPNFAKGFFSSGQGFSGGGLRVILGGKNNADITGMSGGWRRTFTLGSAKKCDLSFRYKLRQTANYEGNEFSEFLVSIDNKLIAQNGKNAFATITGDGNGGSEPTTGWVLVKVNVGKLGAGKHTLILGGFNNQKTVINERTTIDLDDVMLQGE